MSLIVPDTKDWTWVLERQCPDCGFDAQSVAPSDVARLVTAYAIPWNEILMRPGVHLRPQPHVWSPLEYACHVRDVCDATIDRVRLIVGQDGARFPHWDQDAAAIEREYAAQSPEAVRQQIAVTAGRLSRAWGALTDAEWRRRGVRSNGSEFTALTLGRYSLHDLAHHLWDVGDGGAATQVAGDVRVAL